MKVGERERKERGKKGGRVGERNNRYGGKGRETGERVW